MTSDSDSSTPDNSEGPASVRTGDVAAGDQKLDSWSAGGRAEDTRLDRLRIESTLSIAGLHAQTGIESSRIAIIDDDSLNVRVSRKYLESWGFRNIVSTTDPTEAVRLIQGSSPDLVLLDVMMPDVSGLQILEILRSSPLTAYTPVVVLTAVPEDDVKRTALSLGANDFLSKPIDPNELLPRIRNLLTLKHYQNQLRRSSEILEAEVRRRTVALESAYRHVIHCLARAAEYRDNDTGRHVIRVGLYASVIARSLGMPEAFVNMIGDAAKLHDVGKIGISDQILCKPGKLEPEEFEMMQRHCGLGREIIEPIDVKYQDVVRQHVTIGASILDMDGSEVLKMAASIAMSHHERWDGLGYPLGLSREQIPLEGRITAVADVFDAMSTRRTYKKAISTENCFEALKQESGSHFDPQVVDAFLRCRDEVTRIQLAHADC
jgi:putative two-component system response regulator